MRKTSQAGNVLIYVLIGVALFGMLSFAMTRQIGNGGMSGNLDANRAKLNAEELINYATAVRSVAEQMRVMGNVLPNEFSFVKPGETGYDSGVHRTQIYHPAGGGANVYTPPADMFAGATPQRGWVGMVGTNVDWTSTSGGDVLFTFLDVNPRICAAINERIYKNDSIPQLSADPSAVFQGGGGDDSDFLAADCPSCNGRSSLCVETNDGYAFYNIIQAR